jgi:hypothetical protein
LSEKYLSHTLPSIERQIENPNDSQRLGKDPLMKNRLAGHASETSLLHQPDEAEHEPT